MFLSNVDVDRIWHFSQRLSAGTGKMYCFYKECSLFFWNGSVFFVFMQGVSPVNFLSFVAVGHLFSVFPFLDNYFLVSIDKKYQGFFFGGGGRLYNKSGVSSYWTGTRQFFFITIIIIIISFLGIQEGNSWKAWVVPDWND